MDHLLAYPMKNSSMMQWFIRNISGQDNEYDDEYDENKSVLVCKLV